MILVTVGTQKFSFDRLLKAVDKLIENRIISARSVYGQIGHSNYLPKNFGYVRFMSIEDYETKLRSSSIVICHGGTGIITQSLNLDKKVIIVPRQRKFNEHVDDHQMETSHYFASNGHVLECLEIENLSSIVVESKEFIPKKYVPERGDLIRHINHLIGEWLK